MDQPPKDPLDATLARVAQDAHGETTTVGEILDGLQRRGFGPFMALLAVFVCTPIGAIPGLPAVVGAALILFAVQLLLGRQKPWFPARLRAFTVSTTRLKSSIEKMRPWAKWVSGLLRPRMTWLAEGTLPNIVIALAVIVNATVMIIFGFIPLMPFFVGLPILLFGLGLTARDGLVTGIGYLIMGAALWVLLSRTGAGFL
ncbi:MAG: exopolysaccharide biosynthesis protein [Pseudomonadota bacterium]